MSIFKPIELPCPSCGVANRFDACESVNADRRPALREQILDGTFQRAPCVACGTFYRLEPQLTYVELGAGHFIRAAPLRARDEVEVIEARVNAAFEASYGPTAPALVRRSVEGVSTRVVFGWAALVEKLAIRDAGLDDVQVELLKAWILRDVPDAQLGPGVELRFLRPEGEDLLFVWIRPAEDAIEEAVAAPRSMYDEIGAEPEPWEPLRAGLRAGPWVDLTRLMLEPGGDAPAGR